MISSSVSLLIKIVFSGDAIVKPFITNYIYIYKIIENIIVNYHMSVLLQINKIKKSTTPKHTYTHTLKGVKSSRVHQPVSGEAGN